MLRAMEHMGNGLVQGPVQTLDRAALQPNALNRRAGGGPSAAHVRALQNGPSSRQ